MRYFLDRDQLHHEEFKTSVYLNKLVRKNTFY